MLYKLGCLVLVVSVVTAETWKFKHSKNKRWRRRTFPIPENKTPVSAYELTNLKANLTVVWLEAVMTFAHAVIALTHVEGKPLVAHIDEIRKFTEHVEDTVNYCKNATRRLIITAVRVYIFGVANNPTCTTGDSPCIETMIRFVSADLETVKSQIMSKCNNLTDLLKSFNGAITKPLMVQNEAAIKYARSDELNCIADVIEKGMQVNIPDVAPIDKQDLKSKLFESLIEVTRTWRTVISFFYSVSRITDTFEGSNDIPVSRENRVVNPDPYYWITGRRATYRDLQTERLRRFLNELHDLAAVT